MAVYCDPSKLDWIELGGGQRRKICAYNEQEMSVLVDFENGSVGADHTHPHTQISYVLSGEFTYHIEDTVYHMNPGDSVVVESGKLHGCTCIHAGTLLDIFTPMREDFIK